MADFAFIFHPHDIESLGDWVLEEPHLKEKRRRFAERALRWLPPFRRATVTGILSLTGKQVEGDMILWPMIPEQIIQMNSEFTIGKLIESGRLAQRLGARIVGLGAYAAWIGKRGVLLDQAIDIPVTTGTSYTIAVAIEAVHSAATSVGIDLGVSSVTVVGATGCIGRICSQILARDVGKLTLTARHSEKLRELMQSIRTEVPSVNIGYMTNIQEAVSSADIVLISTNTPTPLVSLHDIKSGAVVCDISLPHNILKSEAEERPDVLVIDGGVVKPSGEVDFHFYFGLEKGLAYACMAETMLLALEEMWTSYSLGGNISISKVIHMARVAEKHGFRLAHFTSFGKAVSQEQLDSVKKARLSQPFWKSRLLNTNHFAKATSRLPCPPTPSPLS